MIDFLVIENFQSHQQTKLKLHKGINLIIGESDAGKSAIIRALNWVVNNRPAGSSFRSSWGGRTKVILNIEGEVIKRVRGKKENAYFYKGKYEAFKSEIPHYVKNKLRILPINLQKQMDSHFLFSSSSAEVSRYLNKVVSLDSIDTITTNARKILKGETDRLKYERERRDSLIAEIEKLSWVKKVEKKVVYLERLKNRIEDESERIENMKSLILQYREKMRIIDLLKEKIENAPDIKKLIAQKSEITDLDTRLAVYRLLIINYRDNTIKIRDVVRQLKQKEELFQESFPDYCPLCGKETKKDEVKRREKEKRYR